MTTQPCPTSAFIIAAAFYREARAAASASPGYLILGDQHGEGWVGVQTACHELGQWIEARACTLVDFDNSTEVWVYFLDESPVVA